MSVSRPPSPSIPSRPGTAGNRGNASQASKSVNIYALPPEQEALDLFQQYFSNTGSLFPFIHEESFLETYEAMKRTKFTKVRRTWLGLFNILLAFGMSTSRTCELTAERRAEVSEVYYQRAVGLCDTQVWRGTSLELGKSGKLIHRVTLIICQCNTCCLWDSICKVHNVRYRHGLFMAWQ